MKTCAVFTTQIFILFYPIFLIGQISITSGPAVTPEDLIENIAGPGIQYSNVTYQGAPEAIGLFTNGSTTSLGIESGILVTSGFAAAIGGPNILPGTSFDNGMPGYYFFGENTFDAAILQFDVIPASDTIQLKYVFGSEDYNEFVGNPFQDIFRILVSGINPAGGTYNDRNIAIVPGTANLQVSVNNVNNGNSPSGVIPTGPCTNCLYYLDNTNGMTLEYDGLTVKLPARIAVVPGETYHIKLGIADVGDAFFDSGFAIAENSLTSPVTTLESEIIEDRISIFPNPAFNRIKISNAKDWKCTVLNMLGLPLEQMEISETNFYLDIRDLDPGIYFFRFCKADRQLIRRVLICR